MLNIKEEYIRPIVLINYNREVLFYDDIELFHEKFGKNLIYNGSPRRCLFDLQRMCW